MQSSTDSAWMYGVTTDDPASNPAPQVDALKSFKHRAILRTVFDLPSDGVDAAYYVPSIKQLSSVSGIMGLLLDSSYMKSQSLSQVQARASEYTKALDGYVAIWEIGNEINGNWLGSGVMPKVQAMYNAAKAAGRSTACTFYYENPPTPGYDMLPWIDKNIPSGDPMRDGLDFALVSYYEDQNGGHQLTQTELNTIFSGLASRFPHARVGFGECGWGTSIPKDNATRAALLKRFYGYRVPSVRNYIGGCFYWEWLQTCVPKTQPDWAVLNSMFV